jgi:hypothetical protein
MGQRQPPEELLKLCDQDRLLLGGEYAQNLTGVVHHVP